MSELELVNLLALQKVEGIGDVIAKKLVQHCGSAEAVFKSGGNSLKSIEGIGSILINKLKDKSIFTKAEQELKFIQDHNISTCSFRDAEYPDRLKHCVDGPLLLFSKGNINLNNS